MGGTYPRTENDRFIKGYCPMLQQQQDRLIEMGISSGRGNWIQQCSTPQSAQFEANRLNAQLGDTTQDPDVDRGWYAVKGSSVFYYSPLTPGGEQSTAVLNVQNAGLKSVGLGLPLNEMSITPSDSNTLSFSSVQEYDVERDRHLDLSLDTGQNANSSMEQGSNIVETRFGLIDESAIDSLSIRLVYDAATGLSEYVDNRIENAALLERMSPNSSMPNYEQFAKVIGTDDRSERAEGYLEFARNHTNMIAASRAAGLPFDTYHLLPDASSAVEAAKLFEKPAIINTFARVKEIDAGPLEGFAFIDPKPNPHDDEKTAALRRQFDDAPMMFDPDINRVLIANSVTEDHLNKGVLYHELFESQIHHRCQSGFQEIVKNIKQDHKERFDGLRNDFCDVGADLRTWEFMNRDEAFVDRIFVKYGLPREINKLGPYLQCLLTFKDKGGERLMHDRLLIKVLATLRHVDEEAYSEIKGVFKEMRDSFGESRHAEIDFLAQKMSKYCHPKEDIVTGLRDATRVG